MRLPGFACLGLLAVTVACSSTSGPSSPPGDASHEATDAGAHDAGRVDASDAGDGGVDKSKPCVSTFGQGIGTVGFARFDGTVVAVLPPNDQACAAPNSTHLVLEMSFAGAVYRMVIDVDDSAAPGTIHGTTLSHALVGGPWADGWHAVPLDYVTTLGLHSTSLPSMTTASAVAEITAALDLGAHVSVFATAQGEVDSAHLVHRNLTNQDGAIVVDVDGSPRWLLFAFSDQTF
jgi:hypothetical protein